MILTVIYRAIVILMLGLTVWNMYREESAKQQAASALVMIPLVLRALMIK